MANESRIRIPFLWQGLCESLQRLHRNQSGQVSLLVAILVLGIGVGCCFVGGVAERVTEKIEVQNAADAAAYSNALWAARGMNAVTTCNHLMGELTAICVIHESFGALAIERGDAPSPSPVNSSESGTLSKEIRDNRNSHFPERSLTIVGQMRVGVFEKRLLEPIIDLLATDEGADGRHVNGAALYDSHLRIKELAAYTLGLKAILKALNEAISKAIIPANGLPPIRWALEVADGLIAVSHIYGDLLLLDLAKEKTYLRGLGAVLPVLGSFKQPVRQVLIPAISQYSKATVGSPNGAAGGLPVPGLVPAAQERTLKQIEAAYGVTLVVQQPAPDQFRLPLVFEQLEDGENPEVIDSRNWAGEGLSGKASFRKFLETVGPITEKLYQVKSQFDWAIQLKKKFGNLTNLTKKIPLPEPAGKLLELLGNPGIDQLFDALDLLDKMRPPPGMRPRDLQPRDQNPTLDSFREPRHQLDIAIAQRTQWVRATYPYVDSFRAPLRKFFEEALPNSSFHTYFTHWTNRFTLIECHLRQREDITGKEQTPAELAEQGGLVDFLDPTLPPRMFVLRDALPGNKGNEPWTEDARLAEEYFTLAVVAQRASKPSLFGPGLFRNPNEAGTVCLAQAMFYNANGRELKRAESTDRLQPNTGWDTLNWRPPVGAPEWEKGSPSPAEGASGGGGGFPWQWRIPTDVFTGREAQAGAKVKLNWQSKLVPLTTSKIERMAQSTQEPSLDKTFEFLRRYSQKLLTH